MRDLLATGIKDERVSSEKTILFNLLTPLVGIAVVIFGIYYFLQGDMLFLGIFVFLFFGLLINFLIFKHIKNEVSAFYYFACVAIPVLPLWQVTGGIGGAGLYWYYLYIVFLFFLLGKTRGLLFVCINLLLSVVLFLLQQLGYFPSFYSVDAIITFYFGYLIQTALLYIYQISKERAQTDLKNQSEILKEQKAKLEESNAKNDAILESMGDGLVALDNDGRVMFMNETVHTLLGWSKKELLGKVWVEMIPLQDNKGKVIEFGKRPLTLVQQKGQKIRTSYNYNYIRKNKSALPVSITLSPIMLGGKNIGTIEVFRDVTKEYEVDKMKTEFLSLASHQLRTPLSAMKWNLEMLLAGDAGKLTKEQTAMTKNVDDSNERMIGLINSLLNVSRIESGRIIIDPKMTDLGELARGVIKEVRQKIDEKKQTLIFSANENLPDISIDQQLIRQVYINLLTNAIKYTPEGGEISVFISKKDNEIITQVSDTGYGIPAKDKAKVFEKFYRGENITKIVTDGNGLGMYLVKSVIDSSGGKIWFESTEGKGTTFWFSLPKTGMVAKKGEVTLD